MDGLQEHTKCARKIKRNPSDPDRRNINKNLQNGTKSDDESPSLNGFCPVALVTGEGLLVRGNLEMGLLDYQEHKFAFSSFERAELFSQNPEPFVNSLEDLLYKHPWLKVLLRVKKRGIRRVEGKSLEIVHD